MSGEVFTLLGGFNLIINALPIQLCSSLEGGGGVRGGGGAQGANRAANLHKGKKCNFGPKAHGKKL